jgi:hypothetical protein
MQLPKLVTKRGGIPRIVVCNFLILWVFVLGFQNIQIAHTYTNSSLPFGPQATETVSAYYVYTTFSYRF